MPMLKTLACTMALLSIFMVGCGNQEATTSSPLVGTGTLKNDKLTVDELISAMNLRYKKFEIRTEDSKSFSNFTLKIWRKGQKDEEVLHLRSEMSEEIFKEGFTVVIVAVHQIPDTEKSEVYLELKSSTGSVSTRTTIEYPGKGNTPNNGGGDHFLKKGKTAIQTWGKTECTSAYDEVMNDGMLFIEVDGGDSTRTQQGTEQPDSKSRSPF